MRDLLFCCDIKFQMLATYLASPLCVAGEFQLRGRAAGKKQKSPQQGGLCLKFIGLVDGLPQSVSWQAGRANNPVLAMLVITRATLVITVVIVMPAAVGEDDAATQGQQGKNRNQPGDSTQHFENSSWLRRHEAKTLHRL
jgi:hypothetical protein